VSIAHGRNSQSQSIDGSPRVHCELREDGMLCVEKRIVGLDASSPTMIHSDQGSQFGRMTSIVGARTTTGS
jgi:hypothetical protein